MTHKIDNALLLHGDEPEIPYPALQSIINDAYKPDCDDRYAALQRQVEALEEANNRLADERDFYIGQCHAYEARLAGKVYDMPAGNVHIHTLIGDKAKFGSIREAIDAAIEREILGGAMKDLSEARRIIEQQRGEIERLRQEVTMLRQEYAADTVEFAKLNAMLDEQRDKLLAALTEIAELDILKYHHAYAIAKGAIEEIEALKCSNS